MIRTLILILFGFGFCNQTFAQNAVIKPTDSVLNKKSTEEKSPIKSLNLTEYNAYKNGEERNFASPAELNNYPGPLTVLELEKELRLSPLQKSQLKTVVSTMQFKAVEMGGFILFQEKKLNELFASGKANEGSIIYYTNKIGLYQAELRNAHLQAHLKTRRILTPDQIKKYNRIKNYN